MQSGVMAIVVTYDDPGHARACVKALNAQTASGLRRIALVDNASPQRQQIAEIVDASRLPVDWLRMDTNLGPAGGFNAGIDHFLRSADCDLAWIMDDDVLPHPDCLAAQGRAMEEAGERCVVAPVVLDYTGQRHERWGWAGLLTSRAVVREVGLPRADYFWGSEDGEWLLGRIRDHARIPLLRAGEAGVRIAVRDPLRAKPPWKYYYEARNYTHSRLRLLRGVPLRHRVKRVLHRVGVLARHALAHPGRARSLWMLSRGVVDGATGRLGIRVRPGEGGDRMPHVGA